MRLTELTAVTARTSHGARPTRGTPASAIEARPARWEIVSMTASLINVVHAQAADAQRTERRRIGRDRRR